MNERSFDVVVIGAGPGRRGQRRAAGRCATSRSRSSSSTSSAASAPSTAACRPRRCCAPARCWPRRGASRARRRRSTALDVARRARAPRRGHPPPQRRRAAPWLEQRDIALVRGRGRAHRGAHRAGRRRRGCRAPGRGRRHRHRAGDTADPRAARGAPVDEPRGGTSEQVPPSLVVLGGGPVGVEMAEAYASFGSRVTVIEAGPRVLAREEPFAGDEVCAALRRGRHRGPRRHPRDRRLARRRPRDRRARRRRRASRADEILVAVGRRTLTAAWGLTISAWSPRHPIEVDDTCASPATTGSTSSATPTDARC